MIYPFDPPTADRVESLHLLRPLPRPSSFPSLSSLCALAVARHPTTALARQRHFLTLAVRSQLLAACTASASLSDELLEQLLTAGGVTMINLSECVHITDRGVLIISETCPQLRVLWLDGLNVSDEALAQIGIGCPQLIEIHISRCRRISDGCLVQLFRSCSLTKLDVSLCRQLSDTGAQSALCNCPRLASLALDGTRVSDALVSGLRTLDSLTVLSLQGCRLLTPSALGQLCLLAPNLTWLRLGCTSADDTTVDAISDSLPQLCALSLDGCAALSAVPLPLLLLGCPSLTALDLSRCPLIDSLRFHHSSHLLCELQLSYCPVLSPAALVEIAESCEALTSLWLEGCSVVEDVHVFKLCQGCTMLERVSFAFCDALTEKAIFYVAMLQRVVQLCVGGCAQLKDDDVIAAVSVCSTLRALQLPSRRELFL